MPKSKASCLNKSAAERGKRLPILGTGWILNHKELGCHFVPNGRLRRLRRHSLLTLRTVIRSASCTTDAQKLQVQSNGQLRKAITISSRATQPVSNIIRTILREVPS